MKKRFFAAVGGLFLAAVICLGSRLSVEAASKLIVKSVDYEKSEITLLTTSGDTVAYFSDAKKKNWEMVPGKFVGGEITLDISWINVSKNYTITFKGDVSTSILSVTLPKQNAKFKAKYKANEETPFTFTNTNSGTIQWRKDGMSTWTNWNSATKNEDLSYLKSKGATLYFRVESVPGNAISAGQRASREVTVKIPAKGTAPTVTLDVAKMTIPLNNKMKYRVLTLDENGALNEGVDWNEVKTTKNYPMSEIVSVATYVKGRSLASQPVILQVKTKATASVQESKVTSILIPAQSAAPTVEEAKASIAYTSSASLELVIGAASVEDPYEYCIVDANDYRDDGLDYTDLTWIAVTSAAKIPLTEEKAETGSHIYIRKKSVGTQGEDDFALASVELDLTGSNGVQYPDPPKMKELVTIAVPAGVIHKGDYGKSESFTMYSVSNTTVTSMEFKYGSTSYGTVELSSTAAMNASGKETVDKKDDWIITTKITSMEALAAKEDAWNKELYATITLSNGEKIVSTVDNGGLMLYLYTPSEINNPEESDKQDYGEYYKMYRTDFERVYQSVKKNDNDVYMDENSFKFILDFGTRYVMESKTQPSEKKVAIESISYDAYKFDSLKEYTASGTSIDAFEAEAYASLQQKPQAMIQYQDYVNAAGEDARRAYVTIHVDQFENEGGITQIGEKLPFIIRLNNGEVLSDDIYLTLARTAALDNAPMAWTVMEGSLTESETLNEYDENGKLLSSVKNVINSYSLSLTKLDAGYDVGVSDVTWNGKSILYGAAASGDKVTVVLSNAKINQLVPEGNSSTYNVVIHFDNGYKVTSGCKLTVIKDSSKTESSN